MIIIYEPLKWISILKREPSQMISKQPLMLYFSWKEIVIKIGDGYSNAAYSFNELKSIVTIFIVVFAESKLHP